MASGTFNLTKSSGTSYIVGKIVWSASANNSGNYSLCDADLYVRKDNDNTTLTEPTSGTWNYELVFGGKKLSGSVSKSVLTSWVKIASITDYKISHDNDGSKTVSISGSVTAPSGTSFAGKVTSKSGKVDLDNIPRASTITSASDVTIGNKCGIKWTPAAASFRYKIKFSMGNWSYTTGAIHPNKTTAYTYSGYTIPLACADQYASGWASGEMKATLYTYSDSACTTRVGTTSEKEFTVSLPGASIITSASDTTLGNNLSIKFTPKNSSYRYKVKLTIGDTAYSYTSDPISPGTTSAYTYGVKLGIGTIAPYVTSKTGTMTATLITYRDSGCTKVVGSADTETFTVTVPDSAETKPTVTMALSAVNGSLPSQFDGLYIQGKSRVKADFTSAKLKYKATIDSRVMNVDGKNYSDPWKSDLLSTTGEKTVTGTLIDSRKHKGTDSKKITVIPYGVPLLKPITAKGKIVCARCDENGKLKGSGTHLRVEMKRIYYPVIDSDKVQRNFCEIQYRWKDTTADDFSKWETLLAKEKTTNTVQETLDGVVDDIKKSYDVEFRAIDDVGGTSPLVSFNIPTDEVTLHLDKGGKRVSVGKWSEPKHDVNGNEIPHFELEEDWEFYMKGTAVADFVEDIGDLSVKGDGYDGNWRYKLWNSGTYQMYGQFDITPSSNTALGAGYFSNQIIIQTPFAPISAVITGTALKYCTLCNGVIPVAGEPNIAFRLMRFVGEIDTTDTIDVRLQIQGRWK
jgi:hypothetical protein